MHYRCFFDSRASAIKFLIADGYIKTFKDVFRFIEKAGFARKADIKHTRLLTIIERPEKMSIIEIEKVMAVIRVDYNCVNTLIENQVIEKVRSCRKK